MPKQEVLTAILRLEEVRSENEKRAAVAKLEMVAPHAHLSDLIHHCERDRTHEEIADEALLRERIWAEGGDFALQTHIERQMLEALANPSVPETHYTKVSARILLEGIRTRQAH